MKQVHLFTPEHWFLGFNNTFQHYMPLLLVLMHQSNAFLILLDQLLFFVLLYKLLSQFLLLLHKFTSFLVLFQKLLLCLGVLPHIFPFQALLHHHHIVFQLVLFLAL